MATLKDPGDVHSWRQPKPANSAQAAKKRKEERKKSPAAVAAAAVDDRETGHNKTVFNISTFIEEKREIGLASRLSQTLEDGLDQERKRSLTTAVGRRRR